MRLDFRLDFHACYASFAMFIYMLPYVRANRNAPFRLLKVLLAPKCPIKPPSWAFLMSDALNEPWLALHISYLTCLGFFKNLRDSCSL